MLFSVIYSASVTVEVYLRTGGGWSRRVYYVAPSEANFDEEDVVGSADLVKEDCAAPGIDPG